jgi:hypothetical protein
LGVHAQTIANYHNPASAFGRWTPVLERVQ